MLLNREYNYGNGEELRDAIAKLRPLQLTMLMAELHLRPDSLHKPAIWDPTGYGWREHEGVPRWILVRQDIFNYPPSVFERETMDHFRALAAAKAPESEGTKEIENFTFHHGVESDE